MIHETLNITRRLIVFDTETTGTNTREDRIVEIGFQVWEPVVGLVKSWRSLINPLIKIPESATAVHGIDNGIFLQCRHCKMPIEGHPDDHEFAGWPAFKHLATNLATGFSNCDFAGKNVRFDLRIMAAEMERAGVEWAYGEACIIDIDRLEQLGKPRTLSHLYLEHTGKVLEGAHGALADVEASTEVIVAQVTKYEQLPRTVAELHELQWPGWIDPDGKFKFVNGEPCFAQWGKFAGKPMRTADRGYWDFILRSDFSADTKRLAAAAKLGQYPTPKARVHEGQDQEVAG